MSGQSAMDASCGSDGLSACNSVEDVLNNGFAVTFVRSSATVIAGVKPAAVFSFCPKGVLGAAGGYFGRAVGYHEGLVRAKLRSVLCAYARELPRHGIRLEVVGARAGRVQLLVWRGELVSRVLADPERSDFLQRLGHGLDAGELMRSLRRRLCEYHLGLRSEFPHEIGLVLGYPLEDVIGFMSGKEETCRGLWRVYGDPARARRRFEFLRRIESRCRNNFASGISLGCLLAEPLLA